MWRPARVISQQEHLIVLSSAQAEGQELPCVQTTENLAVSVTENCVFLVVCGCSYAEPLSGFWLPEAPVGERCAAA